MSDPVDKYLNIYADFEFDFRLTRRNATTRAVEPATGLTAVLGRFALTPTGAAITGTSTALTEGGVLGRYWGVVDTATMVTNMLTLVGQRVYAIPSKAGDLDQEVQPYIVTDHHIMGT